MRLTIAAIGRMKSGPEKDLAERYLDRFRKVGAPLGLDCQDVHEYPESRLKTVEERKGEEARKLGSALPPGCACLVLDESGTTLSSPEFAALLARMRDEGSRDLALLVGGPDGHDRGLRSGAEAVVSLGRMTFPHQIARILLAEQLYRAATILAGHPYHRS